MRRWVGVALAGALGGAACDQIHVRSGMLAYRHRWFLGQAWWVAPQFGIAVLAMVLATVPLARRAGRTATGPSPNAIVVDAAWFLGAYAATGLWGRTRPGLLALALLVAWAVRLARRPDRWLVGVASVALAVGGVVYEGTLAGTGTFHYLRPDVYHVPWWLAGLYLQGTPLLVSVTRRIAGAPAVVPVGA